jgi:hypothetical protein
MKNIKNVIAKDNGQSRPANPFKEGNLVKKPNNQPAHLNITAPNKFIKDNNPTKNISI